MDHAWAAAQLRTFVEQIDALQSFESAAEDPDDGRWHDDLVSAYGSASDVADKLISLDPIMRDLMNAAQPKLGDYQEAVGGWSPYNSDYWRRLVRHRALAGIGIHELGEEARQRMRPDSPDLVADEFHPWVWDAAAPLWYAGSKQEAVHAAARSVNARIQQKLGRHDRSDASLCREAFSLSDPAPGQARLRFPGDRSSETWRSRQNGGIQFGAGCFEGIRNITAHVEGLDLPEQVALEQLAAFSLLSRWIEDCETEVAPAVP